MIDKQLLLQGCKQFEIELSTQAAEQLDTYAQLLVEWNGKMNLTAIHPTGRGGGKALSGQHDPALLAQAEAGGQGHRRGHRRGLSGYPPKNRPAGH